MEGESDIELLLINDAPEDSLDQSYSSDLIQIVVLNTKKNRGIHGARVRGIEHSRGNYILLLDQDDKIAPEYLKKQMEKKGKRGSVFGGTGLP